MVLLDNVIFPAVALMLLHPVTGVGGIAVGGTGVVGIAVGSAGVREGVGVPVSTSWGELPLLGRCTFTSSGVKLAVMVDQPRVLKVTVH